ncbi:MAG TPA: PDZ domain-containing protein [Opitutaceae bacterium]|jgi:tricorn protease|nr:PDZ domain-containing protein [Opitutaceae bacterium]
MLKLARLALAFALSAIGLSAQTPAATEQTRLLRFPATNGSQIVFSYAGQLYTVGLDGGVARRLTNGPGYAVFPRFSADGTQLAFTAQYDGNTEVYVMPADGGAPRRLTFTATLGRDDVSDRMGPNNLVMAWKNTRPEIVFRSRMRSIDDFIGQLYSVGLDAELPQQLPVPRGGFMSFSPDDSKMAYNRVFREFRTWKRYRGGQADDIWIFDFKTRALENITNNPAQDIIPMWAPDDKIYFASDRDGHMNLFSYDLATRQTKQHTFFKDYDLKFPSLGRGGIVFEQAGYIWHFDLKTQKARQVPIVIKEDFAGSRTELVNVARFVTDVHPAPDGKRAVVVARGDVFTVPAKDGATRNLTDTSGAHERDAIWSPDGKWIAYVSDETGENELFIRSQDGRAKPVQITSGADTYYYAPLWSPDSKKLLWSDRRQRLRFVDVGTKTITKVDRATAFEIMNYAWSPDSKWVAYARPEDESLTKVWLYSLDSQKRLEVTDGWYAADSPAFSDDGKYLLFASSRDFKPLLGDTEFEHVYRNMQRVYLVTLAKATPSPLAPKSDEVAIGGDDKKSDDKAANGKDEKDGEKKAVVVKVDEDGLKDRLVGLPVIPANYGFIQMADGKIFYLRQGDENDDDDIEGPPTVKGTLAVYDLKERKETELGEVGGFEITADLKKMLVKSGDDYALIDLPSAKIELKDNKLDLSNLEMHLDRRAEWTQIYNECWRQMRDCFYAPNMNGVDWPALRAKYAALLPYVQHRNDLTYLIGELIGELNSGHTYVGAGDRPDVPRIPMGLLGATFSRDSVTRAYRIDRILRGENWQEATRSPLTEIGVDVKEGDYLLAINGTPVSQVANLYQLLIGTAGKQVVLRVNSKPDDNGARDVTVVPIADETPLYYYTWVQHNIDYVNRKTGGKVGYVHIPDMGFDGLNEFAKHFYPQLRKKALIVDVRSNGGGFVSPMIIDRLRRELAMVEVTRYGTPTPDPDEMLLGPKVTLMDEFSASDGDIFPYRFKTLGLGKLIGKRTWGGVVGIRETLPLVDGGFLNRPEFAPYSKDGQGWIIEGHGVDPDIVVDNDPAREFRGEDQQLDKAIEVILDELKTQERNLPPVPPYPIRN